VTVQLRRPATGRTWTVTLTAALCPASPPAVSAKLLDGDIAYVQLPAFFPGPADQVLQAITAGLAPSAKLCGNGAGSPHAQGMALSLDQALDLITTVA
jgi:carboxyl-terminal processing protease